ncbi:MAG: hypothetical protein Q4C72_08410 [Eubacteriales bacterium]|nr:hypothetical protein [Eubacteriales bacterium]
MRRSIGTALAAGLLCLLLAGGALRVRESTAQTAETLAADLRRAASYCYAVEGRYPPDLAYLAEEYGVRYDTSRFYVFYEPVSANLTPSVTVVEAEGAAQ